MAEGAARIDFGSLVPACGAAKLRPEMPDEGVAPALLAQPRDRELGDAAAAPAAQSNQPADPQIRHPGDMERAHARRLRQPYPVILLCSQHQAATAGVIVKPDAPLRQ